MQVWTIVDRFHFNNIGTRMLAKDSCVGKQKCFRTIGKHYVVLQIRTDIYYLCFAFVYYHQCTFGRNISFEMPVIVGSYSRITSDCNFLTDVFAFTSICCSLLVGFVSVVEYIDWDRERHLIGLASVERLHVFIYVSRYVHYLRTRYICINE